MRAGAVQLNSTEDLDRNLASADRLVREAVSKGADNRAESLVAVSKVVDNRAENLVAVSKVVDNRAAVDNKAGEAAKKNKVDGNNYRNEAVAVPDNSRQSTPVACDEPLKELSRLSTKLQTDPS